MGGALPEAGRRRAPLLLSGPLLAGWFGAAFAAPPPLPPGDYTPRRVPKDLIMPAADAPRLRDEAFARARVWRTPAVPVEEADLGHNPPGGWRETDELVCRFVLRSSEGRTPKFQCVLPGGQVIKVKYGRENHERLAEVAGSRLALALGFGADEMLVVRRVTCWGCPRWPFPRFLWLDSLMADYGRPAQFEHAVVERPFPGRQIRVGRREGWAWYELDTIDPARGGASRAERDAFRLFAVFLSHWDNKAGNQRLTCLPGGEQADGSCATPFALIHDFGATFGPKRADLAGWRTRPVWSDGATCQVSLHGTPYDGGTFEDARISEEGRALLADGLARLRPEQVHALFSGARFLEAEPADLAAWTAAFQDRVRQIVDRAPCPES